MKRSFLGVAATAFLLISAVPVQAQTGVKATLSGVNPGSAVSGTVNLRGCGSSTAGIRKIEILIEGRVVRWQSYDGQNEACLDYGWDTTRSGGGLSRNGQVFISVRVAATGGLGDSAGANVQVDNAPSAPGGVSTSNSGGDVHISWSPNPEPDITGYRVERDSGSGWSTLGETQSTSYSDTVSYGTHSYRVIAFRRSSISGSKGSSPSSSSGITYEAPPPSEPEPVPSDGGTGPTPSPGSSSGSGGVPGYGTGPGPGSGSNSGSGSGKSSAPPLTGGGGSRLPDTYGQTGSPELSGIGLPGGLSLPQRSASSPKAVGNAPAAAGDETFEELLPYELPGSEGSVVNDPGSIFRPAFVNEMMLIPPDALRWVGAGLWLIVTALLLKFLERRLATNERSGLAAAGEGQGQAV